MPQADAPGSLVLRAGGRAPVCLREEGFHGEPFDTLVGASSISSTLFDGGLLDEHFDFAFRRRPGLVLYPHFSDRITQGSFDRFLALPK